MDNKKIAKKIVKAIEDDILNRYGLKESLEGCDDDTRKEIHSDWVELIESLLSKSNE